MQFLFPAFLIALTAIAVPIIIHLFHFRRFKKVYFTNVRFLRTVKEETSTRSRLRNLLVLLMRALALVFLVLGFAQPFIPQEGAAVKKGAKAVSVYIDNSFSMEAMSEDVPLVEKAKQRAREIVEAYGPSDEFQVLTNDFEGRDQRVLSQEDALSRIEEIEAGPAVHTLSEVLERQRQALSAAAGEQMVLYHISDFQESISDIRNYADTTAALNLIPLQAVQEKNISIDSAWLLNPMPMPGQPNPLVVRVRNHTEEDAENIRLSLRYDGQAKPVGTLTVPSRSAINDTVNIGVQRTGWHRAKLNITDFPVQFDDDYFMAFYVKEQVRVLSIGSGSPSPFVKAAFSGAPNFVVEEANSLALDYAGLRSYDLIVLNELAGISSGLSAELRQYVEDGGNVAVFPPRNADLPQYRSFLNGLGANELLRFEEQPRQASRLNTDEFIFRDVYENQSADLRLPATQGNFVFSDYAARTEEALLTYRDGSSMVSKYAYGGGNLYVSAAPLSTDFSNLVASGEVFIPMLYRMAISSRQGQELAYTIGQDATLTAPHEARSGDEVYKLGAEGQEFIPGQRIAGTKVFLTVRGQMSEAGYYDLYLRANEPLATYAFNYDRRESALNYLSPSELSEQVGPLASIINIAPNAVLTATIAERSQGVALWRWCLILALAFLLAEVLLLRFWKV